MKCCDFIDVHFSIHQVKYFWYYQVIWINWHQKNINFFSPLYGFHIRINFPSKLNQKQNTHIEYPKSVLKSNDSVDDVNLACRVEMAHNCSPHEQSKQQICEEILSSSILLWKYEWTFQITSEFLAIQFELSSKSN